MSCEPSGVSCTDQNAWCVFRTVEEQQQLSMSLLAAQQLSHPPKLPIEIEDITVPPHQGNTSSPTVLQCTIHVFLQLQEAFGAFLWTRPFPIFCTGSGAIVSAAIPLQFFQEQNSFLFFVAILFKTNASKL